MRTQSPDTSPDAERVRFELLRAASPAQRLRMVTSLTEMVLRLSWQGIRQTHPDADDLEVRLLSLERSYGCDVADALRARLARRNVVLIPPDVMRSLSPVITALESLAVPYYIGGSVASSFYGDPRSTLDIDLVADLRDEHVPSLVKQLGDDYYISEDALRDAIRRRSSFNVIHFQTMLKVDIFVRKVRAYDQEAFQRVRRAAAGEAESDPVLAWASPEDIILAKLEWYRLGGGISDRQWTDILGVMKSQAPTLDLAYLHRWAPDLAVTDLLERALDDAGITGAPPA